MKRPYNLLRCLLKLPTLVYYETELMKFTNVFKNNNLSSGVKQINFRG